jgi:NAD(P)-dependent dehydrogenase (short-subunit alcohol dehydrogenase family)
LQGLANDLEPEGIAAVSIHPGWVRTDMGGPNASIAPETSAAGILEIADRLSLSETGRFLNYDGSEIDW